MVITCRCNTLSPGTCDPRLLYRGGRSDVPLDHSSYLHLGKDFIVYGMTAYSGELSYLILDNISRGYPEYYPACLFVVKDPRASKYWSVAQRMLDQESNPATVELVVGLYEFIYEDTFYERLVDGEEREEQIFAEYRKKVDSEFFEPILFPPSLDPIFKSLPEDQLSFLRENGEPRLKSRP